MRRSHAFWIAPLALLAARVLTAQQAPFDLLIKNARVIDGTGSPWYRADLGIKGDTIAAIAPRLDGAAVRTLDVSNAIVTPGFIDTHTHARRGLDTTPTAANYIRQGVTTVFEGPDGSSPLPLAPFLADLDKLPKSLNIGSLVGQGSIRSAVIGNTDRKATAEDIVKMQALVEQGMKDGAFGLSTGLFYVPGTFTPTAEVIELARVAGRFGGIHTSHQRDDASKLIDSIQETIAIGELGGLPTQVTHMKVVGAGNWGKSAEALKLIDAARARGVDVTIDQYPYTASSTSIASALLPAWALEGGRPAQLARFKDPATRAKIKAASAAMIRDERGGGDPKNVQFANCGFDRTLNGKTLADATRNRDLDVTIDNAADTTIWLVEQGGCQGIFHAMGEDDLVRILRHPATMVASDGEVPTFGQASPHPRSYGTFARVLGVYVRERGVLSLEEAVRKMTSFPAARFGLHDRGVLRPGMKADIAVFDETRVRDVATFDRPHQYAEGFVAVIVNGQVVFEKGEITTARPGRVVYGPGKMNGAPVNR